MAPECNINTWVKQMNIHVSDLSHARDTMPLAFRTACNIIKVILKTAHGNLIFKAIVPCMCTSL